MEQYNAYCVSCRKSNALSEYKLNRTKNGRYTVQGSCPTCNKTCSSFASKSLYPKEEEEEKSSIQPEAPPTPPQE